MASLTPPFRLFSSEKYCYIVILSLAGLLGVVLYFAVFFADQIVQIEKTANQYHLAASNHVLKIKESLFQMEKTFLVVNSEVEAKPNPREKQRANPTRNNLYLVEQEYVALLKLHRIYPNPKFEQPSRRLGKQIFKLREGWKESPHPKERLLTLFQALQITCDQLYRLHLFAHQNLVKQADRIQKEGQFRFIVLAVSLMLLGIFAVFKMKQFISQLIVQKTRLEETLLKQSQETLKTSSPGSGA